MNEKENIIPFLIALLVTSPIWGFFIYVPYRMRQDEMVMEDRIQKHIVVSDPFLYVIGVESSIRCGGEYGWYYVNALIEHKQLGPQYIYDFLYDDNEDVLYYNGNINGINVTQEDEGERWVRSLR